MKDNLLRFIFCLAALDLPRDELHRLIAEFQSMPREEIAGRVDYLRHSLPPHFLDDYRIRFSDRKRPRSRGVSVGERVERLLKAEAGLSTIQAVEKLTSRLVETMAIERREVPPLSRKSLRNWVGRLIGKVPAKDVLRAATILRNEFVHSPVSDWTLRP